MTTDTDVLIIGGGPAGSTTAAFLRKHGLSATVFEKERFPREHVGESLLPFCYEIFSELGLLDQMKSRFVRKPGVRFLSADGEGYTTWCFDRVIDDESHLSFQVARAEFDQLLLENARRLGALVHEETRVSSIDLEGEEGVRLTATGPDGVETAHVARFLVDASGRDTFIGSRMRWRQANEDLDRTAFWSHWEGASMVGGLEDGVSIIAYLGGDKKGWAWVFPLAKDVVTVGFVTDNAFVRGRKKQLQDPAGGDWQQKLYEEEIMRSPFIRDVLVGARQSKPLFINGDYSYFVEPKYGSNFALVGDAGRFIDPIFSSGVFLSMKSAKLISAAIAEKLSSGGAVGTEGLAAGYRTIDGAYEFVHRMIRLFYNPHALSWADAAPEAEGSENESAQMHSAAMAAGHYMLAGDFFENQEKYHTMFDVLEHPRDFKNYKTLVIDRRQYQEYSCRREGAPSNFPER